MNCLELQDSRGTATLKTHCLTRGPRGPSSLKAVGPELMLPSYHKNCYVLHVLLSSPQLKHSKYEATTWNIFPLETVLNFFSLPTLCPPLFFLSCTVSIILPHTLTVFLACLIPMGNSPISVCPEWLPYLCFIQLHCLVNKILSFQIFIFKMFLLVYINYT